MSCIHRITVEARRVEAEGIPLLLSFAPREGRRPLVLILHGLGSHKARNSLVPPNHFGLIGAGFAVASYDARAHGGREVAGWLDPQSELPRGGLRAMLEMAQGTAEDGCHVLDELADHPVVDTARIGAIGVSMGALVLQGLLVREERIRAAVLIHGGDGWGAAQSLLPSADPETLAQLEEIDPAGRPEAFFPRPILCLNGEQDPYFPPSAAEAFLARLGPSYASFPEWLDQRTFPGVGHETVEPMREAAVAWMVRFLEAR